MPAAPASPGVNQPDQAARMRQIRASAGSGKTYRLTSSFLTFLAGSSEDEMLGGCRSTWADNGAGLKQPTHAWPEILAVTFTNRAATEMQERIITRLKKTALNLPQENGADAPWTPSMAGRWLNVILRRFGSLNVRTIDSLLHVLVRLAALDLHLPPEFTPVFATEEALAPLLDTLLEEARADETMGHLLREACHDVLLHTPSYRGFMAGGLLRKQVLALVLPLMEQDPATLADAAQLSAHYAALAEAVRREAAFMGQCLSNEHLTASSHFLNALDKCQSSKPVDLPVTSKMLHKATFEECLLKASKGRASDMAGQAYDALRHAVERFQTSGALLSSGLRVMPFIRLAQVLAAALPAFLQQEGAIPAVLIPRLARQALDGTHGVSQAFCRLGTTLTHILVDEFQDTSREQWQAIQPLVLEALSRGGTLTWVGDVKQAIYSWRGGDASLFDEVFTDPALTAVAPHPRPDTLPTNWRSRSAIVGLNNTVFNSLSREGHARAVLAALLPDKTPESVLAQATGLLTRGFTNAGQLESDNKKGGYVRLQRITAPTVETLDATVREELLQVLKNLAERRPLGDVTILVRSNRKATMVADWLMGEGLPVVTENSFLLAEHPLIIQLIALLTFLDSPRDDLAFGTFVSGPDVLLPLTGLEAQTLHDWLCTPRAGRALYEIFQQDFPEIWNRWIAPFHTGAGLLTAYDATREALERLDIWRRFPAEAVFVRRFLEVLYLTESDGKSSISAFLEHWKQHGQDEKAPMPEALEAVRIMTMHKAKGLQFPVVIVPWHDFTVKANSDPKPVEMDGLTFMARPSPGMGQTYYTALADNAREAMHLLYVAWTRPEDELYAFITTAESQKSGIASALDALLTPLGMQNDLYQQGTLTTNKKTAPPQPSATVPQGMPATLVPSTASCSSPSWRPMQWLPRLRIFRNALEEFTLTPKRRGIFVHHCLACLHLTDDAQGDAERAVERGLRTFPVPLSAPEIIHQDIIDLLAWYAGLPTARHWLEHGVPEQGLVADDGALYRADLVVNDGITVTVVEYKTGNPDPAHEKQLLGYMCLLNEALPLPVTGTLVYLDQRRLINHELALRQAK